MLWVIREDVDVKDEKPRGGACVVEFCCEFSTLAEKFIYERNWTVF